MLLYCVAWPSLRNVATAAIRVMVVVRTSESLVLAHMAHTSVNSRTFITSPVTVKSKTGRVARSQPGHYCAVVIATSNKLVQSLPVHRYTIRTV